MTKAVYSANINMTLSIDEQTSECLKHLDFIISHDDSFMGGGFTNSSYRYIPLIRNINPKELTVKLNLFKRQGPTPILNNDTDPNDWFKNHSSKMVVNQEGHNIFAKPIPGGLQSINRNTIESGAVVQILISFELYKKASGHYCGANAIMDEVVVLHQGSNKKTAIKRFGNSYLSPTKKSKRF